jgi:D-alanyl-D-alanine carboxypeptidase
MRIHVPAVMQNSVDWVRVDDAKGAPKFLNKRLARWQMREPKFRATPSFQTLASKLCQQLGLDFGESMQRFGAVIVEPATLLAVELDCLGRPLWMAGKAFAAFHRMRTHAYQQGVRLLAVSGFRSMHYQCAMWQRKLAKGQTLAEIARVNAPPGFSEHHSGRALDLSEPGGELLAESFEHSAAFRWLSQNARAYGFAMSYPRDHPSGVGFEPWHWCYREP